MLEKTKDLFWLIRQGDNIALFTDDTGLIESMKKSSHTNIVYLNEWPDTLIDLVVIDKTYYQPCKTIKKHLKPDSRVVIHKESPLNTEFKADKDFLFEQERLDFYVYHNHPLQSTDIKFFHPRFERYYENLDTNLCSFSRDYHNPHIYRALIQLGARIENEELLGALCRQVITIYPQDSADVGGCLCVCGYQALLEKQENSDLFTQIDDYCKNNSNLDNPHVIRWVISLYYLTGLYFEEIIRDYGQAIESFARCYRLDFRKFSSLICTKQVSACYKIACLYLFELNDRKNALLWFKNGIERAKEAIASDHEKNIGRDGEYVPFAFSEIAEISNIAALCVNGYNNIDLYDKNRAVYEKLITSKHFGLITYCRKLEKELQDAKNKK